MRNMFAICEMTANPTVLTFAKNTLESAQNINLDELKGNFLSGINSAHYVPDWVKSMVNERIDEIPMEQFKGLQSDKLRNLLSASLPPNLQITEDQVFAQANDQTNL